MHPSRLDKSSPMNAASDIEAANTMVGRLEAIEVARHGSTARLARQAIAARLRAAPGTLENLRRLRLKAVPHWLMVRIRAEIVAAIQNEMRHLEHELHLYLQAGGDPRSDEVAKIAASLAEAKATLSSKGKM